MENVRITNHTPKYCKKVKCHQLPKTWNSAVECAAELHVSVTTVYNACNGVTKGVRIKGTGKFLRLCYEEDYATCQSMADAELRVKDEENKKLKAALEAAMADALKWREYQAKQEAERRAEEARQKHIETLRKNLARGEARAEKIREEIEEAHQNLNAYLERNEALRKTIAQLEGVSNL